MIRFDLVPWPSRLSLEGNVIGLARNVGHSGMILAAYPIPGVGEVTLRTGTLPEREAPYHLSIELARGTLDRLRNQTSLWEESGLQIPDNVVRGTYEAVDLLAAAIFGNSEPERQAELADQSLAICYPLIDQLCREYARQSAAEAKAESLGTASLGVRIQAADFSSAWLQDLDSSFGWVEVDGWHAPAIDQEGDAPTPFEIQSAISASGRSVMVGPLWDAGPAGLPDRINEIQDFDRKRIEALQYFGQLLGEIRMQPDWLHIASGLNGVGHRFLSFPQQIQLVVDLQHLVDEFNRTVQVLISFSQPWGERLAWSVGGAQSIQIADLLLRNDIRLGGFGLEVDVDYWPHGSLPRDPLQWLDLVDAWSQFGMPLFLFLRAPTEYQAADVAGDATDRTATIRGSLANSRMIEHVSHIAGLLLSRPWIHGVFWSNWRDPPGGPFPASGLADSTGRPKPIYHALGAEFARMR